MKNYLAINNRNKQFVSLAKRFPIEYCFLRTKCKFLVFEKLIENLFTSKTIFHSRNSDYGIDYGRVC